MYKTMERIFRIITTAVFCATIIIGIIMFAVAKNEETVNTACGIALFGICICPLRVVMTAVWRWYFQHLLSVDEALESAIHKRVLVRDLENPFNAKGEKSQILDMFIPGAGSVIIGVTCLILGLLFLAAKGLSSWIVMLIANNIGCMVTGFFNGHAVSSLIMVIMSFATIVIIIWALSIASSVISNRTFTGIWKLIIIVVFLVVKKIFNIFYFGYGKLGAIWPSFKINFLILIILVIAIGVMIIGKLKIEQLKNSDPDDYGSGGGNGSNNGPNNGPNGPNPI